MRNASSLHLFTPPEAGEDVLFSDGTHARVGQDLGCGWFLQDGQTRICLSGFDMALFIRAILDEDRLRQVSA